MLKIHSHGNQDTISWNEGEPLPDRAEWLDLVDPTPTERAAVEKLICAPLPEKKQINGLGLSSRHHDNQRVLSLHAHLYGDHAHGKPEPFGIMVMQERLVTLRYQSSRPFDMAVGCLRGSEERLDGSDLLVVLFQAVANDVAEQMQRIGADVSELSDDVFTEVNERTRVLRRKLLRIGQLEGRLARYRTSLLGMGRIVGFVQHRAPDWMDDDAQGCIKVVANDLKTLDQFDEQITGKLQFLQDAVLGFINTDQNAVMKLLTVASVVTIPPVILAGVWGMNFKHMPELDKIWGYPMALAALLISMVVPLMWFGIRGWLSRD
ncbi:MAG: CorA family divalent cation transporter [Rhodanobacter sp.]